MTGWQYSAIMLLAVLTCSLLLRMSQRQLPLDGKQKLALGMAAFVGAMFGGKLPFWLFGSARFDAAPWFADGKTIMFGIAGGYLAVIVTKWALGIGVKTGDSFAMPVAVGVAIGRLGCFVGGCCYGIPTNLPWGVRFENVDGNTLVLRHPTQLYEFLFHVAAALMLFWLSRRDLGNARWQLLQGNLLKAYLVAYCLFRYATEFLRPEPAFIGNLTVYQLAALTLIPVFLGIWIYDYHLNLRHAATGRLR